MHLSTLIPAFFISLTGVSTVAGQSIPVAPAGYEYQFTNLTCASDRGSTEPYLTFVIVEDMNECADKCDSVSKCIFANSYYDVNAGDGKNNTEKLTCSLFSKVLNAASATNCGDQQQQDPPNGRTYITDSYGFSKDTATQ
ncbi:hypothetical protein C8R44DRAFT_786167 [Mycena epipterygia]|nr:hypothetical protein C8R44DRAFT_786167 [Mycena epipterygia]